MNHQQQIDLIATTTGVAKAHVDKVLKAQADIIAAELVSQGSIHLHGIGSISILDTAARKGRNPQTGEEIDIPAGKRIKLKAAKVLKDAVM